MEAEVFPDNNEGESNIPEEVNEPSPPATTTHSDIPTKPYSETSESPGGNWTVEALIQAFNATNRADKERHDEKLNGGEEIVWGVIGAGDVVERKSGPPLYSIKGSRLLSISNRSGEKALEFAKRHSIEKWTTSNDELISDPKVTAVYIATPPHSHLEIAMSVVKAGKPALIEKPLGRNADEANRIVQAFKDAKVPLVCAFYRRSHDRWKWVKYMLDQHVIGEVTNVQLRLLRNDYLRKSEDEHGWRCMPEISGGGYFMDVGCHSLDILDFLFGPLRCVKGDAFRFPSDGISAQGVENVVSMTFATQSGACGSAQWNFVSSVYEDTLQIIGTKGAVSLSVFGKEAPVLRLKTDEGLTSPALEDVQLEYPAYVHAPMLETIVQCLKHKESPPDNLCSGEAAVRTAVVMDKVLHSFYRSRRDAFWTRPETYNYT